MSMISDNEGADNEYKETIQKLSKGLLDVCEPELKQVKLDLEELIEKQNSVYKNVSNEKQNFTKCEIQQIQEMMIKVKFYKEKAVRIKTQMHVIHQRTKNLKAKALQMQEFKVNECATKLQKLHYEECLVASKRTPKKS